MMWRGCYFAGAGRFTSTKGSRRSFPDKGLVGPRVRRAGEDKDERRCLFTAVTHIHGISEVNGR